MSGLTVSVIIPVYNAAPYLARCVESVLSQGYDAFEIVLADDGSTDGSGEVCDALAARDGRVRVLHKKNGGAGAARNNGIALARGEYVLFLDSDDALEPGALARLAAEAEKTGADVYFFRIRRIGADGAVQLSPDMSGGPTSLAAEPSILFRWGDGAGGAAWRRALFDRRPDVRFGPWRAGEDLYMTRRMLAVAGSAVFLPDALYDYYIRPDSSLRGSLDSGRDIMEAMEGILAWYRQEGLFEKYREELCALCVLHVFVYASWRALYTPGSGPVLRELRDFTVSRFPGYRQNRYVRAWPLSRRAGMALLSGGMYPLLRLLSGKKSI